MTIEDIETICDGLPAVTKDIKWGEHLCFNVAAKMFLITSPDAYPPNAVFKVSPEEFEELIARNGFSQAPHLAKNLWIKIDDISKMSKVQWEYYARQSYNLVIAKLSKKTLDALKAIAL